VIDAFATNSVPLSNGGWSTGINLAQKQERSTAQTTIYFGDDQSSDDKGSVCGATNGDVFGASVAVYSFVGRFSAQWPLIFASALIAMLPVMVFYFFMQRTVMRGFTSTLRG